MKEPIQKKKLIHKYEKTKLLCEVWKQCFVKQMLLFHRVLCKILCSPCSSQCSAVVWSPLYFVLPQNGQFSYSWCEGRQLLSMNIFKAGQNVKTRLSARRALCSTPSTQQAEAGRLLWIQDNLINNEYQTRHSYTVRPSQLSVLQRYKQTENCLFLKPTRSEVKSSSQPGSSSFYPLCKLPKTVSGVACPQHRAVWQPTMLLF